MNYNCLKCNKLFNTQDALNAHNRVHTLKKRSNLDILKIKEYNKQKRINNNKKYDLSPIICLHCQKILPYNVTVKCKTKRKFCSHSCAATYNNQHKKHGTTRSKLEKFIEQQLKIDFPNLIILFNDKTAIKSELDIYIPELHLAFELNGIFHYEPIFSHDKLTKIKNNDNQKIIESYKHNIELIVLDVSKLSYFIFKNAIKYYLIIKELITKNINRKIMAPPGGL